MIKKTKALIAIFIFTTSISCGFSASLRGDIQYLVKKYGLSDAKIAIAAQRTQTGNNLYSYAQNRLMKPASNNKVFTMVGALFAIPNNFRFTTYST